MQVTLDGKQYTMKKVSLTGIKMLGTRYLRDIDMEHFLDWIVDDAKCKTAIEAFAKFLCLVLVEPYIGADLLHLEESEVLTLTDTFFESARVRKTENSEKQ